MVSDLITPGFINSMLGTKDDELETVETIISWIEKKAESIIGRKLTRETRTSYLEGFGNDKIILPVIPVIELTSVSLDSNREFSDVLDPGDYYCDLESGVITLFKEKTPEGVKTIKVVYTAGFTSETLPSDLKFNFVEAISWNLNRLRDKNFGVRNMTTPDGVNISNELVLPMGVQRTIESYRDMRI